MFSYPQEEITQLILQPLEKTLHLSIWNYWSLPYHCNQENQFWLLCIINWNGYNSMAIPWQWSIPKCRPWTMVCTLSTINIVISFRVPFGSRNILALQITNFLQKKTWLVNLAYMFFLLNNELFMHWILWPLLPRCRHVHLAICVL
jgi:hypothetical protein